MTFAGRVAFALALWGLIFALALSVVSGESLVATPSVSSSLVQTSPGSTPDVLVGKNTKGPYPLSWKSIQPESETIIVDGVFARRGVDYTIDYESGMVSFTKPIRSGSMAQAQYRLIAGKSVRNTGGLRLPIEMDILQRDSSSLRLVGLYKEADPNKTNSGMSVFGLAGNRNWGSATQLSSQFMVSSTDDTSNVSLLDRAALNFGAARSTSRFQLKTNYKRTGESFAGAKDYGLTSGVSTMDMSAAYAAGPRLTLSGGYAKTEDIAGADKGASKTTAQQTITYAGSGSQVALSHKSLDSSGLSGGQTQDINKIEASRTLGATATAVSVTTTNNKDAADNTSKETTSTVAVQAGPKLSVKGSYTEGSSSILGSSDSTKVGVTANPTDKISVSTDIRRASSDIAGDLTSTGVNLQTTPSKNLKMQANYLDKESSLLGAETARGVRVEGTPLRKLTMSAGYSERFRPGTQDITRDARLRYQPGTWLTLGGGAQATDSGGNISTITDVNAVLQPWQFVSISGLYKNREMYKVADSVDTVALGLSISAATRLKLTAGYQRNPEDANTGAPLAADNTTVGAETRIGSVSLSGGYTRKNDYALGSLAAEKKFGFGLPMFGHGLLSTGYKESEAYTGFLFETKTYSLGYTHNIGQDFNLMLSGSMTMAEMDNIPVNSRPDYEAQAKLGLRF